MTRTRFLSCVATLLVGFASVCFAYAGGVKLQPLQSVQTVDWNRYQGTWLELASIQCRFRNNA